MRESKSDPRQFKVDTGAPGAAKPLLFRAEDPEQRWRWVSCIRDAQAAWSQLNSRLSRALSVRADAAALQQQHRQNEAEDRVTGAEAVLRQMGAGERVVGYVAGVLRDMQAEHEAGLAEERAKRSTLLHLTDAIAVRACAMPSCREAGVLQAWGCG